MTRKRFIKLRMGDGLTRNQAMFEAGYAQILGRPYKRAIALNRLKDKAIWKSLSNEEREEYVSLITESGEW